MTLIFLTILTVILLFNFKNSIRLDRPFECIISIFWLFFAVIPYLNLYEYGHQLNIQVLGIMSVYFSLIISDSYAIRKVRKSKFKVQFLNLSYFENSLFLKFLLLFIIFIPVYHFYKLGNPLLQTFFGHSNPDNLRFNFTKNNQIPVLFFYTSNYVIDLVSPFWFLIFLRRRDMFMQFLFFLGHPFTPYLLLHCRLSSFSF